MKEQINVPILEATDERKTVTRQIRRVALAVVAIVLIFLLGFGSGYLKWGQAETAELKQQRELAQQYEQVNPEGGFTLPVSYGNLGPQLIEAGVIDYESLLNVMAASGDVLTNDQIDILQKGSNKQIVITAENAHFLLNFFWAVGLTNENIILTGGPMVQKSSGQIGRFASTGGWSLATKPIVELYASMNLIPLSAEQQRRVEEVAVAAFRPCCNNSTLFPDCNHGMAMLGMLELMASQGASVDKMFEAAKYVNAYWFPQQTLETAVFLKTTQNIDFKDADARLVVGKDLSSASGAAIVHQSLQSGGLLKGATGQGGSCTN